ncbi:hypothetical protein GGR54DRAFT_478580 [Hypoxylon sp. NC1633]|nr:hypothetical protein GGR54DRAFT_478580 [Hypoxylon sp. NC1633]
MRSKSIWPSTVDGIKNTHYGKGVYFTPIAPTEIGMYKNGIYESTRLIFNDVTAYSVDRMQYYIGVQVDEAWRPLVARDPRHGFQIKDIWLVASANDALDIKSRIIDHGTTVVYRAIEELRKTGKDAPARDYAYQLNKQQSAPEEQEEKWQRPKPSEFVFIDGHTVRRPPGWDDDFLSREGYAPN